MAICEFCNQEMKTADGCDWNQVVEYPDGTILKSIPWRPEQNPYITDPTTRCHDCGVAPAHNHHPGCDMERCPKCLGQLISCGCLD